MRKFNETSLTEKVKYHDLYLESDALLLADVFENFRKMCLSFRSCKMYFSFCISMASSFKKTKVKLENC